MLGLASTSFGMKPLSVALLYAKHLVIREDALNMGCIFITIVTQKEGEVTPWCRSGAGTLLNTEHVLRRSLARHGSTPL
jgi:hypothetical protein